MYLVIDSALCRNRKGQLVFLQAVCDPKFVFNEFTFLGMTLLERHTTTPFHHRQLYRGIVEREVVFGIKNPRHNLHLAVGIVVPSDFNFSAHLPRCG